MHRLLSVPLAVATLCATAAMAAPEAYRWEIGPIIRGKNYSQGMPLHPRPARGGWQFDFPAGSAVAGHVHYVTFRSGPIAPDARISVRYRIDAPPGTRFVPQESPGRPATVSLYFQRRGDNWSAKGRFEHYRWYAPAATVRPLATGEQEISVRLDDPSWISVLGKTSGATPEAIAAALADVDRIGLVFGSAAARGHGVYATAPARFTLLGFDIR
ncbi:hypothetical protein [Sphingopyxis sp.]|uniref:hypothetical protein n=1 Tax=Sphingopyxis sp. TaxID=1908224 RepID=UPI00260E9626|nr:hypothetical protein [Sphingopyxis sp.]MCW0198069.1 hypothetical protein [Sphingopyxis sp.]